MGSEPTTLSARSMALLARDSWRWTRPRPGERPRRHHDGLAVGVVEGMLGEPGLDQLDQAPVAERVPDPGGHVVDARAPVASSGGPSRASPATAMMAATTRSTGITSVTPSGTPGNSRSRPRA